MPDNVGRVGSCPSALEGTEETGTDGWALGVEDLGGLGTDIT